jgi:hypothetical protein
VIGGPGHGGKDTFGRQLPQQLKLESGMMVLMGILLVITAAFALWLFFNV